MYVTCHIAHQISQPGSSPCRRQDTIASFGESSHFSFHSVTFVSFSLLLPCQTTYVGLIMGISRALSVFTRDEVPKRVYVWYGLDFGKCSDSWCRASGRRCRLCVLGVGGLVLAVMSVHCWRGSEDVKRGIMGFCRAGSQHV